MDSGYMIGWILGLTAGMVIGISIGITIGTKQKPWSELTDSEKRKRIAVIAAGTVFFAAGVLVLIVR